jgi:hypothetical protein
MLEVSEILASLAKKRPVFHSEADFQHAIAWEIHHRFPDAAIRLERPVEVNGQFLHVDVWIIRGTEHIGIELKYKTRDLSVDLSGERFRLRGQSAQDIGRYDFVKDIQRLEQLAAATRDFAGYAILLTNDSAYWADPAKHATIDASFRINNGRLLKGTLAWGANAGVGTMKNREGPLMLRDQYVVRWTDYSHPSSASYGLFRSITISVCGLLR